MCRLQICRLCGRATQCDHTRHLRQDAQQICYTMVIIEIQHFYTVRGKRFSGFSPLNDSLLKVQNVRVKQNPKEFLTLIFMLNVYKPVCMFVTITESTQLIIVEMLGSHLHEQEKETRSQDQGSMKGSWSTTGAAERCDEERPAEECNNYLMLSTLE